ncbi:MAG: hypothetical protein LBN43_05205 [Oscillospiraceae bacterium]|jgi:hypothetical protein|nr:hypothetical protein [Oscillospiraceae bacterium]
MEATRYFDFEYTCEHCGNKNKGSSSVKSESGFNAIPPPGAKGVRISAGGRTTYGAAAENHLRTQNCPKVEREWDNGQYPQGVRGSGKCSKCKEYQHWSSYFDEPPGGYGTAQKTIDIDFACGVAFFFLAVSLIISVIVIKIVAPPSETAWLLVILKRGDVWLRVGAITILSFLISGLLRPLYARTQLPKWEKRKELIEQKPHLNPTFISWAEKVYLSSFHR